MVKYRSNCVIISSREELLGDDMKNITVSEIKQSENQLVLLNSIMSLKQYYGSFGENVDDKVFSLIKVLEEELYADKLSLDIIESQLFERIVYKNEDIDWKVM